MSSLSQKIDFAVIFSVKNANPNGDPLNGNRPRISYEGYGEISDVCLKRKIRDRLLESGENIFVQSDDRKTDNAKHLKERAENAGIKFNDANKDNTVAKVCEIWFDVRAFGQVFAYEGKNKNKSDGVSIGIRGPVTVQPAFSVEPITISSTQITKSVNNEKEGGKASDTMGLKHRVDKGVYVFYGSMNPQLAEKTGFSDEDAEKIKEILPRLFENDASSARPEGSMKVEKVYWWAHDCKSGKYSSAKVHGSLDVLPDGTCKVTPLEGLEPEEIQGF